VGVRTNLGGERADRSFEEFFTSAWPWAYRLAVFLTHDSSAAEDLAQEALASMSRQWGAAERPEAYLRRSVVNLCWNWHRHRRVVARRLPLAVSDDGYDAGFDELADALAALPYRQRAVVVLRYYGGLSEAEIAAALGCRPGTVKSLASRALATLAEELPR
jgi:RNA polymerase sigma-70 factor (sigma-E family)